MASEMEEEDSHLLSSDESRLSLSGEGGENVFTNSAGSPSQEYPCHGARTLTEDELLLLRKQDSRIVTEFKQKKLESEAKKNWDLFYKRNTTKFFKDRHWTTREFQELCGDKAASSMKILEVGCGVGNFIFPLMEELKSAYFYACDFSQRAVHFVKENPSYSPERCCAFQCDLTKDLLTANIKQCEVDIVSMIFVLSAIHPTKMFQALRNIHSVLKPGGLLLFRDYGLYDHAQLRFSPGHKLSENFYFRQDGTRAYYFSTEYLSQLVTSAGYEVISCEYVLRETVNQKEGVRVPRVFVQGRFLRREAPDVPAHHVRFSTADANNTAMGTVS